MKIDNYSYSGRGKKTKVKTAKTGIGIGYIIILILFFVIFVVMAILLIGMRRNVKNVEEEAKATVNEDGMTEYTGFKEAVKDTFTNKVGYEYSISFEKAEGNAYYMDDCILRQLTDGSAYVINGQIIEKGASGTVNLVRDDYSATYSFGFTRNVSLLDMDITEYLSVSEDYRDREDLFGIGYVSNIDIKEYASGTDILSAINTALLSAEPTEEEDKDGSYTATYPEGAFNIDTDYEYLNRIFNNYPGELTLSISSEEVEESGQHIVRILGSGKVPFTITLNEHKTLGTQDTMIQKCYAYSEDEGGAFGNENVVGEIRDFREVMDVFKE